VWRPDDRYEGATLHRHRSYGADPSTLLFVRVIPFAGGDEHEKLGRPGGPCQRVHEQLQLCMHPGR
jgi:hypothetical protein